ncbi:MAG: hypothetical protein RLZ88_364 [Actinomycetota bacterium]
MNYEISTALERLAGPNNTFACYLPPDVAAEIDELSQGLRGGFGSVRVRVVLGGSSWTTSIFKVSSRASYLLLVGKQVREAEGLANGEQVLLVMELLDFRPNRR